MTEKKPVKRYSMTMDSKRWDLLTRRAKSLNTSNTAILNQLVEAYLNGPANLPAGPSAEVAKTSNDMIGGTYTAILEKLSELAADLTVVKQNSQLAGAILETDSGRLEEVADNVEIMAEAFRRSQASRSGQPAGDRPRQPGQPPADRGATAYTVTPAATDKRDRLQRLAEAQARRQAFSMLPGQGQQQPEGGAE